MMVSAHPLVVAVALGLLGPGVLREEIDERSMETCPGCTCGTSEFDERTCESDDGADQA